MYRDYDPNGGMYIATSLDGVNFTNAMPHTNPIYTPDTGVRDPMVMWYQGQFWMVYTYGWPAESVPKWLCLATSEDSATWTFRTFIELGKPTGNNLVDVPHWAIGPDGVARIVGCIDDTHEWVEVHAKKADAATWSNPACWTHPAKMLDVDGLPLVAGNSFIACHDGTWYMIFDPYAGAGGLTDGRYYLRTSTDVVKGWSKPVRLDFPAELNDGDAENVLFLPDGTMRFYVSNGNTKNYNMWYLDSRDHGKTWTGPELLSFEGFGLPKFVNWAQVAMFTENPARDLVLRRRNAAHS